MKQSQKILSAPSYAPSVNFTFLLLRIAAGGFLLTHGYAKLLRVIDGNFEFGDPIGIGPELSLGMTLFTEIICAFLFLVGLLSRVVAIPLLFTMLIAVFVVHGADSFAARELGLFYLFNFAAVLLCGPGKFSLDYYLRKLY